MFKFIRICFGYVSVDRDWSYVTFQSDGSKGSVVANILDVNTLHRFLVVTKPFSKNYLVLEFGRGYIDEDEIVEVHTIGRDDTREVQFTHYREALSAVYDRLDANADRFAALPHTGGALKWVV